MVGLVPGGASGAAAKTGAVGAGASAVFGPSVIGVDAGIVALGASFAVDSVNGSGPVSLAAWRKISPVTGPLPPVPPAISLSLLPPAIAKMPPINASTAISAAAMIQFLRDRCPGPGGGPAGGPVGGPEGGPVGGGAAPLSMSAISEPPGCARA